MLKRRNKNIIAELTTIKSNFYSLLGMYKAFNEHGKNDIFLCYYARRKALKLKQDKMIIQIFDFQKYH